MLSDLLKKAGGDLELTMLELGALPIDSKSEPFHALLDQWAKSKVVAFEPDAELCSELNRKAPRGVRYYPTAVAKRRETRPFYETVHSMCGSLFPPDERYADLFHNLDVMRLKKTSSIDTVPLDEFVEEQAIGCVDFIKMDIQGAELEALQGAAAVLQDVLFIVCEVEFVPLYLGQPLFGDVDAFLRSRGFTFHKFIGGAGRTVKPLVFNNDTNHLNQQMWADAIFIRDLFHLDALTSDQLQKMAIFLALYGSPDVALFLLNEHDRRTGTKLGEPYLQALTRPALHGEAVQGPPKVIHTMVDGVKIVVPDSLDLITTYVLSEQQDWFEDDIKFLRRLLQPGQRVIDIGANYGTYTLSMAKTVGPTGCVWAFEPASTTAGFLAESMAVNHVSNVVLERSALSKARGTACLSLNANSELNALTQDPQHAGATEVVKLVTLDDCMNENDWLNIEFIKIDAEGEESNILEGGKHFFDRLSPLIQYEIRAGDTVHMELIHHFTALGYDSYRLVPGLNVLVPIDAESMEDGYLLNLYCCKQDRARSLAGQGFLVPAAAFGGPAPSGAGSEEAVGRTASGRTHDWRSSLAVLPYGAQLLESWKATAAAGNSVEVEAALAQYAVCQDPSLPLTERVSSLEKSFRALRALCERDPSNMRLASLARVARDFGYRACAVQALQQLLDRIVHRNRLELDEPFLAPGGRFDLLATGPSVDNWMLAAILEEIERLGSYSSYYTGTTALPRLEKIRALGFGSAEMGRRLSLVQQRFGLPGSPSEPPAKTSPIRPFPPSVDLRETRYGRMLVPVGGQPGAPSMAGTGELSQEEFQLFSQFVGIGSIVLDVGASVGTRTVPLAQLAGSGGVVVAFEPQPVLYKNLCANLVLNSIPNAVTYAMALGPCTGECQLRALGDSQSGDLDGRTGDDAEEGEVVPLGRLDDFQLDRVDFIRLDVGGDEAAVLEGAAETIKRCRPIMYIKNDHAEKSADLIQRLFEMDYRLWWHAPPQSAVGSPSPRACSISMLAIHRDMRPITGLKPITTASDAWL
ncbi:MAG: FkbM family methyltransferase [Geothrix sp.]|uniref:FkbM family methyltransferase n=1 Tax=Geothrix sp. TaxID=1962974 RepID=UPI0017C659DF|nr:FkbM family methyltransferase [Geothrix sp.]NWJ41142.1 FkbM family methyltransferase [Geothrix sp.]WIL20869.1 MAG: FkbM family methyltransferase [Geothrix sp.]